MFAGHHNPLSDTDLDSLLSSLSPSSTNSSSSPQQQNTNGEDEDEHDELSGFKIESLLDFVLEDNNNQLEPTNNTGTTNLKMCPRVTENILPKMSSYIEWNKRKDNI